MTPINITLALGDYARVLPLALGKVRAEGVDLDLIIGDRGSWPMRADFIRRTLIDPTLHGGEGSMGGHLKRVDEGDRSFVALPIFLRRGFVGRYLYVQQGSPLKSAADLAGKRIGMYAWQASGAIWYRHFLREAGLDLNTVQWWTGGIDEPGPSKYEAVTPAGVNSPRADRSLSDMLRDGELDAIYCSKKPKLFHQRKGPFVRIFDDVRAIEEEIYQRTKVFPILHIILLRRDVFEAYPWLADAITKAFAESNRWFAEAHRNFPYETPWAELEIDGVEDLMGRDFHTFDIAQSRPTLEAFFEVAHEVGLTRRRVTVEEFFAEYFQATGGQSGAAQ